MGKRSERMSNFWTVRLLKTETELNFSFPHITSIRKGICSIKTLFLHFQKCSLGRPFLEPHLSHCGWLVLEK